MQLLKYKKIIGVALVSVFGLFAAVAFGETQTIGDLADTVTGSFGSIGKLFIAAAYIAGFALTIASIFKFKAHKDNPTQVPLGTPIALLVIGVLLVFIPSIFGPAGSSVFGDNAQKGGFDGGGITKIDDPNQ